MKNLPPIRFIILSIAFVIVGVLPAFEFACPIDGGTGLLKAAQGLKVESVTPKLISEKEIFTFGACGMPIKRSKFTYAVDMLLTNESIETSKGTVTVAFHRFATGQQVMVQNAEGEMVYEDYRPPTVPAYVSVPAGTTKHIERVLSFIDEPLAPGEEPHKPGVEAGVDMRDPTCGGTGKLRFIEWLNAIVKGPPSFE
mgnify:CR=1 FL=1